MGTKRKKRVLAIDDEPAMTDWLKVVLEHAGYEVRTALIGVRGEELFKTWKPDAVLTDMMLPDVDGIELVRRFKELNPQSEVVVVSGQGNIPRAVEAIKAGASYFLEKPIDADGMLALLEKAIERTDLQAENRELKAKLAERYKFGNIIGRSKKMEELFELVESVAASEANILIQGDNGTGKELIANAIHYNSKRSKGPFIKINCAAIPKDLIESELFGYKKGAFTGALIDKEGLFEMAEGGSLLLDEIGEMPPYLQTKLLRVLQEREYRPIGSERIVHVDFRLICATNIDLEMALREGKLREDLYFRINTITLRVPPAARAHRRHSAAVRLLPREIPAAVSEERQDDRADGVPSPHPQPMAGQRAGARERHRTRRARGEGHRDHRVGSAGIDPRGVESDRRVRHSAASHAGRDRTDGDPADAAADELEQAGSRTDPRLVPADAVQQDEEARHQGHEGSGRQ